MARGKSPERARISVSEGAADVTTRKQEIPGTPKTYSHACASVPSRHAPKICLYRHEETMFVTRKTMFVTEHGSSLRSR
jgi:hypothetical protein